MSTHFNVSVGVIRYAIKNILGLKPLKKPKHHYLTEATVEKRYRRSWGLYKLLKCDKWKNYISVDEAWFYLTDADGQRDIQYVSREKTTKDLDVLTKPSHPRGVMVFMGISYNGPTKPIFVDAGAKINSEYYINKCLKPLIREANRLYPEKNWMFHQDSAPSHTSKRTLNFLKDQGISFIPPKLWTPSSPDLSPCDYFLWGYLKSQTNKHNVKTIPQLKRVLQQEVKKIPLEMIQKALKRWPKLCRAVYYNKGLHIK